MKWKDCVGRYNSIISLGNNCQVAHQLNRLGLRQAAGPLDWFSSDSTPGLIQLLQNRFRGLMDFKSLQLVDRTYECYVIRDQVYDIVSYHDFPLYLERWWEAYPAFKEKVDRRIHRFWHLIHNKPVLFIRTETSLEEAKQLKAALDTLVKGGYRLLIMNPSHPMARVVDEEWSLRDVCCVTVPRGQDWRGSDDAWNLVMSGFSLQRSQVKTSQFYM
ncbi:DUF1796 family putative cysteine peptidase [Paenibacillus puerhi]|uniref:DUF1796 family putative cysteine peptidase n=1 Tax=Paenibacillus puerhi TaxID=2692622 RepID=UPI00135C43D3|nr:DUF1796 family putative cysteine peptidase [Paenibacillus puerhi]